MTRPDGGLTRPGFALFCSGASFSCAVLSALSKFGYQPDLLVLPEFAPVENPPSSNGMFFEPYSAREILTLADGVEIAYAPKSRQLDCADSIRRRQLDFVLIACWPYLICDSLIASPRKAMLNLHPSLLPAYRGPTPLPQQLANRETSFGVTLHMLNQDFDRGDIVAQSELTGITADTGLTDLEQACARLGAELFIEATVAYESGWRPRAQPR